MSGMGVPRPVVAVPVAAVALLDTLSLRDDGPSFAPPPSSTLRSRKPAHSSASDSLDSFADAGSGSEKKSALSDGVLGVRTNGDAGSRKLPPVEVPGLASPACSRCSSVQFR